MMKPARHGIPPDTDGRHDLPWEFPTPALRRDRNLSQLKTKFAAAAADQNASPF
jgi:hypothetical protein